MVQGTGYRSYLIVNGERRAIFVGCASQLLAKE